jgi:hypothetical protein
MRESTRIVTTAAARAGTHWMRGVTPKPRKEHFTALLPPHGGTHERTQTQDPRPKSKQQKPLNGCTLTPVPDPSAPASEWAKYVFQKCTAETEGCDERALAYSKHAIGRQTCCNYHVSEQEQASAGCDTASLNTPNGTSIEMGHWFSHPAEVECAPGVAPRRVSTDSAADGGRKLDGQQQQCTWSREPTQRLVQSGVLLPALDGLRFDKETVTTIAWQHGQLCSTLPTNVQLENLEHNKEVIRAAFTAASGADHVERCCGC